MSYQSAFDAFGAFDALGDPTRRAVFELLRQGPVPVGQLASRLPVSRPAVSKHLRVLKDAGLVSDEALGTRRLYRVNPDGVAGLRAYLDQMWDAALGRFADAADALDHPKKPPRERTTRK